MTRLLWMWLPDEVIPLLVVGVGLALIIGLVGRATAGMVIGGIALLLLLGPFVAAIMGQLPVWILILAMAWFFISTSRLVLGTLFGKGATDEFVGHFMWAAFTAPFRVVRWLLARR